MSVNLMPQNDQFSDLNQNGYWIRQNRNENVLVDKYDFRNKILNYLAPEAQYETVRVLNELAEAHYDRILEYELATAELGAEDADLKILFAILIADSRDHISELCREIENAGGELIAGSANAGKSYFRWTNFKRSVIHNKRRQILLLCEDCQRYIQKAYQDALREKEIPAAIKALVLSQAAFLKMPSIKIEALARQQNTLSVAS